MDAISILILLSVSGWSVAAYAWFIRKTDEITTLRQQLANSEARVAELERTGSTSTSCPFCFDQMRNSYILRKQAEAVEEAIVYALRTVGNVDPFEVDIHRFANDYAQRLRRQADELERPQSPQEGSGYE